MLITFKEKSNPHLPDDDTLIKRYLLRKETLLQWRDPLLANALYIDILITSCLK